MPARVARSCAWIWPAGARGLLAAVVIAAALGLAVASHSVPEPGAEIVKAPDLLLDLNTVPARVLETLPHVGQTLVRQIVAAREPTAHRIAATMPAAGSAVWGQSPWRRSLRTCDSKRPFNNVSTIPRVRSKVARPRNRGQLDGRRHESRKPKRAPLEPRLVSLSTEPEAF